MKCSSAVVTPDYRSNYDKRPCIEVPASHGACVAGWDAIAARLREAMTTSQRRVFAVDCYSGVHDDAVASELARRLTPSLIIHTREFFKPPAAIDDLVKPFLGGGDPIFGFMCDLRLEDFFDTERLAHVRTRIENALGTLGAPGVVLIVGPGASAASDSATLVFADMPRWEGQLRQRRDEVSNLGVENQRLKASLQYKRSYFVDWRVLDRWKRPLLGSAEFFLDTTNAAAPKLAAGDAVRRGLVESTRRPFRAVPFFDPGPWGGQWMRTVCGLDGYTTPEPPNYAWCFDCVPEENSLLLRMGSHQLELPASNLVFQHPRQLLGDAVHTRFGAEFPIRFDFLDTMDGGNLSFQVHPLTEYIRKHFGMTYTQDESYYLLDAGDDGTCYLGVKSAPGAAPGVDPAEFRAALESAQAGGAQQGALDVERFANCWPARKHDHFLIPAGTVHCSGRNTMVLEISATPYIFTFKLWDWGRLGLDGKPRPINIERGMPNIHWERDTDFCRRELINHIEPVARGDGWTEERTGLHHTEFIETRRHWFTNAVPHDTGGIERGGVNVLNLVEGREAIVESPTGAFAPFEVHYAETFIVPAMVGRYTIRPTGQSAGQRCATLKAYVRRDEVKR